MAGELFRERVRELRAAWEERRQTGLLASAHTFDAQFRLLDLMYSWVLEAMEDIRNVYAENMPATVTDRPSQSDQQPSFTVSVGAGNSATFVLAAARRRAGREWHITAQVTSAGGVAAEESAPAGRRVRRWSRRRVDDILLALLGAHERSRAPA